MKILLISKENKEKLSYSENLGISPALTDSVAQDDNEIEMTKFLIVKLDDSVSSFHTSLALSEF